MLKHTLQFIFNGSGDLIDKVVPSIKAQSNLTNLIQVVAPIDASYSVFANYDLGDATIKKIKQYLRLTNQKGIDVVDPERPYAQTVAEWNVWEMEISSVILSAISKKHAGNIIISFDFSDIYYNPLCTNFIGTFGIDPATTIETDLPNIEEDLFSVTSAYGDYTAGISQYSKIRIYTYDVTAEQFLAEYVEVENGSEYVSTLPNYLDSELVINWTDDGVIGTDGDPAGLALYNWYIKGVEVEVGDYYTCNSLVYTSAQTGETYTYGEAVRFNGVNWVKGSSFNVIVTTPTQRAAVDPAFYGQPIIANDELLIEQILAALSQNSAAINSTQSQLDEFEDEEEYNLSLKANRYNSVISNDDNTKIPLTIEALDGTNTEALKVTQNDVPIMKLYAHTDGTLYIQNVSAINGSTYGSINFNETTGTNINRNRTSGTVLTVDNINASWASTNRLLDIKSNGSTVCFIDGSGLMSINSSIYGQALLNQGSATNAGIYVQTTGTVINRDVADSNPALIVQQVNADSTGDIIQFKNFYEVKAKITEAGNVGIGVSNPSEKLEVDGNIVADEIILDGVGVGVGQYIVNLYSDIAVNGMVPIYNASEGRLVGSIIKVNNTTGNIDMTGDLTVDGDIITTGDLSIDGNLLVKGSTTTVNTETIKLEDNLIEINSGQTGTPLATLKSGLEINRGDLDNFLFVFDELDDRFKVGVDSGLQTVATRLDDDTMIDKTVPIFNSTTHRFENSNVTYDSATSTTTVTGDLNVTEEVTIDGLKVKDTLDTLALDYLQDVTIDTPLDSQVLRYDATSEKFVNTQLTAEDIAFDNTSTEMSATNVQEALEEHERELEEAKYASIISRTYTDEEETTDGDFVPATDSKPLLTEINGRTGGINSLITSDGITYREVFEDSKFISEISGRSIPALTNLVTNGSFNTDVSDWYIRSGGYGKITRTNNRAKLEYDTTYPYIGTGSSWNIPSTDKVYVSIEHMSSSDVNTFNVGFFTTFGVDTSAPLQKITTTAAETTTSFIETGFTATTNGLVVRALAVDEAGKYILIDNVIVINLTKTFGAGNEPTVTEMDEIVAMFKDSTDYLSTTTLTHIEDTEIKFIAKNLFDKTKAIDSRYVATGGYDVETGNIKVTNTAGAGYIQYKYKLKPLTTYTLYANITPESTGTALVTLYDGSDVSRTRIGIDSTAPHLITFTTGKYGECLILFYNNNSTVGSYVEYINIQLEEGSSNTDYEAYTTSTLTFEHDALKSIPSGVCDKIRYDTTEYVIDKYIGTVTLDGTQAVTYSSGADRPDYAFFFTTAATIFKPVANSVKASMIVEPQTFIPQTTGNLGYDTVIRDTEGISIDNNSKICVRIAKSKLTGWDEELTATQKQDLFLAYVTSNPIMVQAELANPVIGDNDITPTLISYTGQHLTGLSIITLDQQQTIPSIIKVNSGTSTTNDRMNHLNDTDYLTYTQASAMLVPTLTASQLESKRLDYEDWLTYEETVFGMNNFSLETSDGTTTETLSFEHEELYTGDKITYRDGAYIIDKYTGYVDDITTHIADLNNKSLQDIFETGNFVNNSGFDGSTPWYAAGTASISNGKGYINLTSGANIRQDVSAAALTTEQKIFVKFNKELTTATSASLTYGFLTSTNTSAGFLDSSKVSSLDYLITDIITITNSVVTISFDRIAGNGSVAVDNAIAINLTTLFGAGNEPTKAVMDSLYVLYENLKYKDIPGTYTLHTPILNYAVLYPTGDTIQGAITTLTQTQDLATEYDVDFTVNIQKTVIEHINELQDLTIRVPIAPTSNGTYRLQVTVTGGVPTYTWVSTT